MIYIVAQNAPVLFVCLTFDDWQKLRTGTTLFVDRRVTGGKFFDQVVISLHRTKADVVAMIRTVAPDAKIPDNLPEPPPREGEFACDSCRGSHRPEQLFEGRCICCWADEAKKFRLASN